MKVYTTLHGKDKEDQRGPQLARHSEDDLDLETATDVANHARLGVDFSYLVRNDMSVRHGII